MKSLELEGKCVNDNWCLYNKCGGFANFLSVELWNSCETRTIGNWDIDHSCIHLQFQFQTLDP